MKRLVGTGLLVAMCVAMGAIPASAQQREARRQARIERQEKIRERAIARRDALRHRLDMNRDGSISRREVRRYRAELRRTLRKAYRR